jgi:hypothetical protein
MIICSKLEKDVEDVVVYFNIINGLSPGKTDENYKELHQNGAVIMQEVANSTGQRGAVISQSV